MKDKVDFAILMWNHDPEGKLVPLLRKVQDRLDGLHAICLFSAETMTAYQDCQLPASVDVVLGGDTLMGQFRRIIELSRETAYSSFVLLDFDRGLQWLARLPDADDLAAVCSSVDMGAEGWYFLNRLPSSLLSHHSLQITTETHVLDYCSDLLGVRADIMSGGYGCKAHVLREIELPAADFGGRVNAAYPVFVGRACRTALRHGRGARIGNIDIRAGLSWETPNVFEGTPYREWFPPLLNQEWLKRLFMVPAWAQCFALALAGADDETLCQCLESWDRVSSFGPRVPSDTTREVFAS